MESANLKSPILEAAKAVHIVPPAPGLAADSPAPGLTPPRQQLFDGQCWFFRNGFDQDLRQIPRTAWQFPNVLGWQRIKRNARREVWRAEIGGTPYYLKYYVDERWRARLKALMRLPACQLEWNSGLYALQAGLPAVAPAGYTTNLIYEKQPCSLLVTEAVEPSIPLDEFWQQLHADPDPLRRRTDMLHLVDRLAEMIAQAHQSGFAHMDMHAANILVQPVGRRQYRTLFVDLQSARLGVPLDDRAVVRNLAQLNQWFRRHSALALRLRFLRAYYRWRNEYEHAYPHGRPLTLPFPQLVRALSQAALDHADRLGAQRDRRARRDGQYYGRLQLPDGWRARVILRTKHATPESPISAHELERGWWQQRLSEIPGWFQQPVDVAKDSHSADVRRSTLPHPQQPIPVVIKRVRARNWRRRLRQLLPPARALRAWLTGHALLNRHIATARPLAALERRAGPFTTDSILVTEAVPDAVDLDTHLRDGPARYTARAWHRHKRTLCDLLARELRKLELRGFVHRDCKASNLLLVTAPEPKLVWIDMDGIRRRRPWTTQRATDRALVTLCVSLLPIPQLSATDWARLLRAYTTRFGADVNAWRVLWRRLAPAIQAKRHAKAQRRAWKRRHYGRE